jgi:PAS domain S-box-containing protein
MSPVSLDYRTAFELAPIGLVLSRQRQIVDCNVRVLDMFGASRALLVGRSFEVLYPTHEEFERTGERIVASLDAQGWYADDRVMKRLAGTQDGELFWCHVSGRALNPQGLGRVRPSRFVVAPQAGLDLTAREREIAALLING